MVITTEQLHSIKPELRFRAGLNPVCDVPEIHNGENVCVGGCGCMRACVPACGCMRGCVCICICRGWVGLLLSDRKKRWSQDSEERLVAVGRI